MNRKKSVLQIIYFITWALLLIVVLGFMVQVIMSRWDLDWSMFVRMKQTEKIKR